jgi:hypothetical protein
LSIGSPPEVVNGGNIAGLSDAGSMTLACCTCASTASPISRAWVVLSKSKTTILPCPAEPMIVSVRVL